MAAALKWGVSAGVHANLKTTNFLVRAQVELELCKRVYDLKSNSLDSAVVIEVESSRYQLDRVPVKLVASKCGRDIKNQLSIGNNVRLADRVAYAIWLVDDRAYGPIPTLQCAFRGTTTLEDWLSNFILSKGVAGRAGGTDAVLKDNLKKSTWSVDGNNSGAGTCSASQTLEIHAGINLEVGRGMWDEIEAQYHASLSPGKKLSIVLAGNHAYFTCRNAHYACLKVQLCGSVDKNCNSQKLKLNCLLAKDRYIC
jgi:hypothetical protein